MTPLAIGVLMVLFTLLVCICGAVVAALVIAVQQDKEKRS